MRWGVKIQRYTANIKHLCEEHSRSLCNKDTTPSLSPSVLRFLGRTSMPAKSVSSDELSYLLFLQNYITMLPFGLSRQEICSSI